MDLVTAKSVAWYGGMTAAIIGLVWIILQMFGKVDDSSDEKSADQDHQKKFLSALWGIFLVAGIPILIMTGLAAARTTVRGSLLCLFAGILIPPVLVSLESQVMRRIQGTKTLAFSSFASFPLAGLGISLLVIGVIIFFYGIRAEMQLLTYIIGTALGMLLVKISAGLVSQGRYEQSANRTEGIMYITQAALLATILAGYHFKKTSVEVFFPVMILLGLFVSILVSTVLFRVKPTRKIMEILPVHLAVFIALFLGLSLSVQVRMNLSGEYYFPLIAGVITSVVYLVIINGSLSGTKNIDLASGAMSVLILLGGLWFSYKWGMGLGMTIYATGLLSVTGAIIPYVAFEHFVKRDSSVMSPVIVPSEGDPLVEGVVEDHVFPQVDTGKGKPGEMTLGAFFLRSISLAGLSAIFFGMFRVFVQHSPLIVEGLDITYTDYVVALFLGIIAPLCFEGFNLAGTSMFPSRGDGKVYSGILQYVASVVFTIVLLLSMGILFQVQGLAMMILGFAITALLGTYTYFSQRKEQGLYRASFSPLWIAAAGYSIFLIRYRDVPDQLTRLMKQQTALGMILLIAVIYFFVVYQNRKQHQVDSSEGMKSGFEVDETVS